MPEETTPPPTGGFLSKLPKPNPAWLAWLGTAIIAGLIGYLSGGKVTPPIPAPPDVPIFVATFGWVDDEAARDQTIRVAGIGQFADTPAGKAAQGDGDVFLWQAVRKVNTAAKPTGWYPNVNQTDVGCCVGCGFKHACDVAQAVQILDGRAAEWKPVAVEAIYGGSRVEVGGGRISGDGSVGAWAADWVSRRGGLLPMQKFANGVDLAEFSPARARTWGRTGVPDDLEGMARAHPVGSAALVRTWQDVQRSVGQGYPIAVCSDVGFAGMHRDADGFVRASGSWPHCMAIIGTRGGPRPGAFLLNSWGDEAHRGPVWPTDAPLAGFWADAATVGRMVAQGDSYALSDVSGFPARVVPIDWFAAAPRPAPKPQSPLLALAW